jgi:drug/metabolite transporter (DMT)-like permease
MFLYVQPVVAAAGGILLLGEELSPWLVGGGVLILAGVAVSQFTPKQMTARNEDNPEADARGRSRYELMS